MSKEKMREEFEAWLTDNGCSAKRWPHADSLMYENQRVQDYWTGWQAAMTTKRPSFLLRVREWMLKCFGPAIAADMTERCHRFYEEATEKVQAHGMTRSECHQLVDYTFDRPVGEPKQETGGVMVTLAALDSAAGIDTDEAAETELARINDPHTMEKIRAKQAAKPKHSPLPMSINGD